MIYPVTIKTPQGRIKQVVSTEELIAKSDAEFKKGQRQQRKTAIKIQCRICEDHVFRQEKSKKTCSKAKCVEEYKTIQAEREAKRKGKR